MFTQVGQIMLYVNNQEESVKFWTEVFGFTVKKEFNNNQGMRWIEIVPKEGVETSIILHDKDFVAKMSPGLNLDTPSLMFFTDDLDQLHSDLVNKNVTVGEIVDMPSGRVFNFADNEENYFAVMEKNS